MDRIKLNLKIFEKKTSNTPSLLKYGYHVYIIEIGCIHLETDVVDLNRKIIK